VLDVEGTEPRSQTLEDLDLDVLLVARRNGHLVPVEVLHVGDGLAPEVPDHLPLVFGPAVIADD